MSSRNNQSSSKHENDAEFIGKKYDSLDLTIKVKFEKWNIIFEGMQTEVHFSKEGTILRQTTIQM